MAYEILLPDDILEKIFFRLDDVPDLGRACTACTTFSRIISKPRFIRRFLSLHPPPVLGLLELDRSGGFHPADLPHSSAPAARAFAEAADFSFADLPDNLRTPRYRVCDVRDGRILLGLREPTSWSSSAMAEFVVYDPLHRHYFHLPRIPLELLASMGNPNMERFDSFLDSTSEEEEGVANLPFRVIRVGLIKDKAALIKDKALVFQFRSATGEWHGITIDPTLATSINPILPMSSLMRHFAHGCFYWTHRGLDSMYMLDMRERKFSATCLPSDSDETSGQNAIVEAGEGILGLLTIDESELLDLYCVTLGGNVIGPEEWQYNRTVSLPEADMHCWRILGTEKGYALLHSVPRPTPAFATAPPMQESQCWLLDCRTCIVERLCLSNQHIRGIERAHLYASLPPPLAPPSI